MRSRVIRAGAVLWRFLIWIPENSYWAWQNTETSSGSVTKSVSKIKSYAQRLFDFRNSPKI